MVSNLRKARGIFLIAFLGFAAYSRLAFAQDAPKAYFAPIRGAPDDSTSQSSPYTDPHAWPSFDQAGCQDMVFAGGPPTITKLYEGPGNFVTCNDDYVVLDDPVTSGPIWAAEHLTRDDVSKAKHIAAHVFYHDPSNLPAGASGRIKDYQDEPYVYGLLAAQGDMTSIKSQYQVDNLANTVPINNTLAYGLWPKLGSLMRAFAAKYGDEYVISGPIFSGSFNRIGPDGVAVPNYLYKAFYLTHTGGSGVYVVANDDSGQISFVSLEAFTKQTGISPFPLLPMSYLRKFQLPDPRLPGLGLSNTQGAHP